MELALNEAREHCEIYTGLSQVIRGENAETAQSWVEEAVTWEERQLLDALGRPIVKGPEAVQNPYESRAQSKCMSYGEPSIAKVWLEQSLEKARLASAAIAAKAMEGNAADERAAGRAAALTNFILRGFKIEVSQYVLTHVA